MRVKLKISLYQSFFCGIKNDYILAQYYTIIERLQITQITVLYEMIEDG